LATVQAVEAIREADIIRLSDGCGGALLHFAPARADIAPLESAEDIVLLARTGRSVTVLFPGNPYAFSNGSAMAEKLERAGIDSLRR
jgi:siroheme synthase